MQYWSFVVTPSASIAFGIFCVAMLFRRGSHRVGGAVNRAAIVETFLIGISLYTFSTILIGHFFFHIAITRSITEGFGENRLSWLLIGVVADHFARLYGLLDP
jgi:hypothetical protein